jgi:hypothetical protein
MIFPVNFATSKDAMPNRRFTSLLMTLSLTGWFVGCAVNPPSSSDTRPTQNFAHFAIKLDRLNDVALPLLIEAANLCKSHVHASYGFELHDKSQYKKLFKGAYLDAAIRHYGLQHGVAVRYVHPRLPAGAGGLRAQDVIISMEGEPLVDKTAQDAEEILHRFERRKEGPLHLVVKGADGMRELDLYSLPSCNYPVVLVESGVVNAFADGAKIIITTGMLDFCANETELALVIGHEIAHNALRHADDVRLRKVLDALYTAQAGYRAELAATATQLTFSKDFETAADYVGLYIAARAGHDISQLGAFWRRLARQRISRNTPAFAITHPGFPERFALFQTTLQEIQQKQRLGNSLNPGLNPIGKAEGQP